MSKSKVDEPKAVFNRTTQDLTRVLEGKDEITVAEAREFVRYGLAMALEQRGVEHAINSGHVRETDEGDLVPAARDLQESDPFPLYPAKTI